MRILVGNRFVAAVVLVLTGAVAGSGCGSGRSSSSTTASASGSVATKSRRIPPGGAVPNALRGAYAAHFGRLAAQTSGTWHLVLGPGHHARIWNTADHIARRPDFEAGPVSFAAGRMTFATVTAEGRCTDPATYTYTLKGNALRFAPVGKDPCFDRSVTFPTHTWHRR
jgi:hypothetical protein